MVKSSVDNGVYNKGDIQKYICIVVHDIVSSVRSFARNIIGLDR